MASPVADIFALNWLDVSMVGKLMQLDKTWQGSMQRWLTAQTSVVLRDARDVVLTWVSWRCPHLQTLDISGCRKLTTTAVVDAVRRCPLLKTLIALGCTSLAYPAQGDSLRGWEAIRKARGGLEVVGRGSRLTIRAECEGSELWFNIGGHTRLSKLTNIWFERQGLPTQLARFFFGSHLIQPNDTCASLGLEDWVLEYYTLILFLVLGFFLLLLLPKKYILFFQGLLQS